MVSSVESISFEPNRAKLARGTVPGAASERAVPAFFYGPENALLGATVEPLIYSGHSAFQPLVLVGPSGTGKSHLAAGIAAAAASHRSVTSLTAADFARQATETTAPAESARRHRALHDTEALILEDIHHLAKKTAAQNALASLLDTLVARDATVIVTSTRLPAKLQDFVPSLVDRLSAGLVLSLSPPGSVVRRAMIAHIADREQLAISDGAADRLAEAPLATWNELRGALLKLRFAGGRRNSTNGSAIRLNDVRQYLAKQSAPRSPELREIARAVAKHFGLKLGDLQGRSRRRGLVDARMITAYLARKCTSRSLQQIGQYLGGRDHTTILHGIRKIEQQLAEDAAQQQMIRDLLEIVCSGTSGKPWKTCPSSVGELSVSDDH